MSKRNINWIFVHHSASDAPQHDSVEGITALHKARGFSEIGYHWFVKKSGEICKGRDEDKIGAHVKNHNHDSIGICISGFFEKENPKKQPNDRQLRSLEILLIDLCSRHHLKKGDILGHNDVAATLCPGFDLHSWLKSHPWE